MKNILTGSMSPVILLLAADAAASGVGDAPPKYELPPIPPISEVTEIELKKLVIDAGTQPRVAIDDEVVKEYTEVIKLAIKEEQPNPFDSLPQEKLPQVFRDSTGRCVLADGFHRYAGHKGAHAKEMRVAIRAGSQMDALIFSLGTNQDHGVRRTNKDKARAVKVAFSDSDLSTLSNSELAKVCGVTEFMIREYRPAKTAATTRSVTIRGKKTTMNTAAIGKGKGGGAKGKKAAAKKTGKGKNDESTTPVAPAVDAAKELDKMLLKIVDNVGVPNGGKFRAAVNDQSLPLSMRDIRDMHGMSPEKQKAILPLVTGALRMKPAKAFDFITSELPERVQTELHNRAIGTSDGIFTFQGDGFKVTVELTKKGK